eukprot:TRINITY_DN50769_c0_g1_i1.p1 TRINITY_DN50769_c0_g1~~TRINITY_DN50769_c0_g1_i1.p1  ORF type:complete len:110 (-),score=12.34 TRINITY_DN50769_c0_g1_i1:58-351(-)
MTGFGFLRNPYSPSLIGQFENGKFYSAGLSFSYSEKYRTIQMGNWKNGKLDGPGLYVYPSGDKILGKFTEGEIDWPYLYIFENGTVVEWPSDDNPSV